jgi:hypothetical protein
VKGISSNDPLEPNTLSSNEGVHSLDTLEHGQTVPTLENASQNQNAKVSNLVYEVTPGHAEGWESVTLERTMQGVKVVICMGHAHYRLEPTPFVLEGLLKTIRRIARGQIPNAKLGCVGWRALEVHTTARQGTATA